jgi:uncharacterized protein YunC (DUF1805 family)
MTIERVQRRTKEFGSVQLSVESQPVERRYIMCKEYVMCGVLTVRLLQIRCQDTASED